jgi:hypothetical protein
MAVPPHGIHIPTILVANCRKRSERAAPRSRNGRAAAASRLLVALHCRRNHLDVRWRRGELQGEWRHRYGITVIRCELTIKPQALAMSYDSDAIPSADPRPSTSVCLRRPRLRKLAPGRPCGRCARKHPPFKTLVTDSWYRGGVFVADARDDTSSLSRVRS